MSSWASFIFLFIFSFLTSFRAFAQDFTYRYHSCPNTTLFSSNSTYLSNLKTLLSSLSSPNASYSTRFQNATVGEPPDRVTGLFDCRGDLSPEVCRNCVAFAVKDALIRCPNERDVMIFYDECSLRYSNPKVTSAQDFYYIYHICPNTTTYSRNSTYFTNLRALLSTLSSPYASYSTGFQNATVGQAPDRITGLFLCRGDMLPEVCRSCVAFAVNHTFNLCPNGREAVVYYDECILRYSHKNILSTLSTDGGVIRLWNLINVTSNQQDRFRNVVMSTMNQAAMEASSSSRKFNARKANYTALFTVYGLVQCTPDLTRQDCLSCLQQSINQLPVDKIGGRIIVPSCNTRYELFPFYNESHVLQLQLDSAPPPPSPPPISITSPRPGLNSRFVSGNTGKGRKSSLIIIAVVVPIIAVLLLFVSVFTVRAKIKKTIGAILFNVKKKDVNIKKRDGTTC